MFELVSDQPVEVYSDGEGKTPFTKHLRWKLKTRDVEWMEVSPAMANEMLKYNSVADLENRPRSKTTVARYARLIKEGKWGHQGNGTCEPIIFSDKKRLLSGQHRLAAIELAGVPQRMLVVFGEPDENFAFIDQGRRRTSSDIFAINKVPNYTVMSAACVWVLHYIRNRSGNPQGTVDATPEELYRFYLDHQGLQKSMPVCRAFKESKLASATCMTAMHYICAQKNRSQADEYFMQVATGIGLKKKTDPAFKVRDRLLKNQASQSDKLSTLVIAAYVIKGWNAFRGHGSIGTLKWRGAGAPNEAFPRAM